MPAKFVRRESNALVYEVTIPLDGSKSMLDQEKNIREALNVAGTMATGEILKGFDADGRPIVVDGKKYTCKGVSPQHYECPFGRATVERHVYQSSMGGKTFCPLEHAARMIENSTPMFAKIVSFKYANSGSRKAGRDLEETLGRKICPAYMRTIGEAVGEKAEIYEATIEYELPDELPPPKQISTSLDGTCMLMSESGWREAMAGSISLYDADGERQHTIYVGAAPEFGKQQFLEKLEKEVLRIKARFPDAEYVGLADGAPGNWSFLEKHTTRHIVDFYHVSEYVKHAANALYAGKQRRLEKESWIGERLSLLKHEDNAAANLLEELISEKESREKKIDHKKAGWTKANKATNEEIEVLTTCITYFENNRGRMDYAAQTSINMPIGSGVIEAACKELIKQRMVNSGMRWKDAGAAYVIAIRSLVLTNKRWEQLWEKFAQAGCPEHKNFSYSK